MGDVVLALALLLLVADAESPPPPITLPIEAARPDQPTLAPAEVAPTPVRTAPDWAAVPSSDDMLGLYPPSAMAREVAGRASIRCVVKADGMLKDCVVEKEEPAGEGFGDATVRAAARFRLKPATADGAPVEGGSVRITLRWSPGG